jgi:hypothetical protein
VRPGGDFEDDFLLVFCQLLGLPNDGLDQPAVLAPLFRLLEPSPQTTHAGESFAFSEVRYVT